MLSRYKNNLDQIVVYDFINKFNYKHNNQLPRITQISLNISDPSLTTVKPKILSYLYLIRTITNQIPKETQSKKNKVHLKIKRGSIVGCKINLNSNQSLEFMEYITLFVAPQMKNFTGFLYNKKDKNQLSLHIKDWYKSLPENLLSKNLSFYNKKLSSLQVTMKFNTKLSNEIICMLNSYNFPIK
jgi:large subunit ribosomal protein L5